MEFHSDHGEKPLEREEKAAELLHEAYRTQMKGDIGNAVRLCQASLHLHPTAEAHTFLGWAYSFLHRYEEAINECKSAIALDPDLGNPYNDVGLYLMKLGKLEEALPWLEQAITAKRYEARHYPHLNLGRLYLAKGDQLAAMREFSRAVEIAPCYVPARFALAALASQLN